MGLRGGVDQEPADEVDEMEAGRDYGDFCVFPEEGLDESFGEDGADGGETLGDEGRGPKDDFVLQLRGLDEDSEEEDFPPGIGGSGRSRSPSAGSARVAGRSGSPGGEASGKGTVWDERDIQFYGVSPEWAYSVGKDNQELLARRRQRRLAWSSLVVPWEASDAALDEAVPGMLAQLREIDPSVERDDLAAALFKLKQCRTQISHVREQGIRHGWKAQRPSDEVGGIETQPPSPQLPPETRPASPPPLQLADAGLQEMQI